jgi:hypothetical protein
MVASLVRRSMITQGKLFGVRLHFRKTPVDQQLSGKRAFVFGGQLHQFHVVLG